MKDVRSFLIIFWIASPLLFSQPNPNFNVSLQVDFASAEQMIALCEGKVYNVDNVAQLRGNQIAAATSMLLARTEMSSQAFPKELENLRDNVRSSDDIFGLDDTKAYLPKIKALLEEAEKHDVNRRVVATIEQFFPNDLAVSATVPVYFVAMGNENAAAFVRRIVWHGNVPEFVGEGEGELSIVVNLTRSVEYIQEIQMQYVEMLSTLAHETFHAVFGVYQNSSLVWRDFGQRPEPYWALAEVVQNEGIAYLISTQQQRGGNLSPDMLADAERAVNTLNKVFAELASPQTSRARANDLILNSNLSGSFEKNYGATAGLLMAYSIDAKLGRKALTETIVNGVPDFFRKYDEVTAQFGELPKLSDEVLKIMAR